MDGESAGVDFLSDSNHDLVSVGRCVYLSRGLVRTGIDGRGAGEQTLMRAMDDVASRA